MNKFELQKLRDLPIEEVAEQLGLQVMHHKSLCPFHNDHHASLSFNVRRNTFRCFVCGANGGTIDLTMRVLNTDFKSACRFLNDGDITTANYGYTRTHSHITEERKQAFDASKYERFFINPWLSTDARSFLYEKRMLDQRVIRWCRLTSWRDRQGVNWLQIPYYDADWNLIGIQQRNLNTSEHDVDNGLQMPRFRFPRGSKCSIYNLPVLKKLKPEEPLFITEGCSDCWAMLSFGHKAIAIPSATLLKPDDTRLLKALTANLSTPFHMYPDKDEPGERLFMQLRDILPNLEHHHLPVDCKDFADYYVKKRKEVII